VDVPDVSYAHSGDVAIAYQVVGEGPTDLVIFPFLSNIWSLWHLKAFGDFGHKIARGRRVIVVNPRGVGLSDRPRGFTVESRMDDLLAVMEAVGSERTALLGTRRSAGGGSRACAPSAIAGARGRPCWRTRGGSIRSGRTTRSTSSGSSGTTA
jgi:pimeloyl-ACP methyl ester carboxylesterase